MVLQCRPGKASSSCDLCITITRWSLVKNVEPSSSLALWAVWFSCHSYMLLSGWTITSKTVFMPLSSPDWQEFGCRAQQKGSSLPPPTLETQGLLKPSVKLWWQLTTEDLDSIPSQPKVIFLPSEHHLPSLKPSFSLGQSSYSSKDS